MLRFFFVKLLVICAQICLSKASCCSITEDTIYVPVVSAGLCLKAELFIGGAIRVDPTDSTCVNRNFLPQSVSEFDSLSGNVALYSEGQLGKVTNIIFLEDTSLSSIEFDVSSSGDYVEIIVKQPSCAPSDPSDQREILIEFFGTTGGDDWRRNNNWLSSVDECEWYGITCDSDGNVIQLILEDNELNGTIPDTLTDLTNLRVLKLGYNYIGGSIPNSLGNLSNLRTLYLWYNELGGPIPNSIGQLTHIDEIYFKVNYLTGTIPESIGNLRNMTYFYHASNLNTGQIPDSFGNCLDMHNLRLQYNDFSGTIPSSIGMLTRLNYLYLHGNELTGTIPETFENLSNLDYFWLRDNHLTGEIPGALCNFDYVFFHYGGNNFTNDCHTLAPTSFFTENPTLSNAPTSSPTTSHAPAYSDAPTSSPLTQREALIDFYESTNGDGWNKKAQWLSLVDECEWYGIGCNSNGIVTTLILDNNNITGTIPESLGDLSLLREVELQDNSLTGTIPGSIGKLGVISAIDFSRNEIGGTIPDSLGNLRFLIGFRMSQNHLTGTIPSTIGGLPYLAHLYFSDNDLTGTIPDEFIFLFSIRFLWLHNNKLTGTISDGICNRNIFSFFFYGNPLESGCPEFETP